MSKSVNVSCGVVVPKLHVNRVPSQNQYRERSVTRNAPFATNDTPESRVRIVGSRLLAVEESSATLTSPGSSSAHPSVIPLHSPRSSAFALQGQSANLNQRTLVPALQSQPTSSDLLRDAVGEQTGIETSLIGTQLERFAYPSEIPKAIPANSLEEDELMQKLADELGNSNERLLRDIYVELAGVDRRLTGYVSFADFGNAFNRCNMRLSVPTLRQLCCLFVSNSDTTLVHYEKALSFVSKSLLQRNNYLSRAAIPRTFGSASPVPHSSTVGGHDGRGILNPITGQISNYRAHNNAQLLQIVTDELLRSKRPLNIEQMWNAFAAADRDHSGYFSYEQMRSMSDKCNVPLSDAVMNDLISLSHNGNGQYRWQQYLKLIERCQHTTTHLNVHELQHPVSRTFHSDRTTTDVHPSPSATTNVNMRNSFNQQLQSATSTVAQRERELNRLENVVQDTYRRLATKPVAASWSQSFSDLSQALFRSDTTHSGLVTALEARWLTREYNDAFGLGFTDSQINAAISRCNESQSDAIQIEKYLRTLSDSR